MMATEQAAQTSDATPTSTSDELTDAVERYRQAHPEVEEAMRVFEMSDAVYRAAVDAMYGPRISWANSTNPSQQ
ncbi:MAG: hypothetical protein M3003_13905 [Candidatus Dormibacteraeota bacterium]|nr:hypothetical protein [Candidatus Dormibacteraeota bacterium]